MEPESAKKDQAEKIELPPFVQEIGKKGLATVQHWFYHDALKPSFTGRANIPDHTHFIVVANHSSHLDMGLVKMALGDAGENLVALAAADYFFDNKVKRTIFENFTNLVPMERKGSLRKSLEWAFRLLEQGYNVLVFPEGTRSRTGVMQPFQRGIGHLVLRAKVGILPMHLSTYEALPPGTWYPQSRDVSASIGPFLSFETLSKVSEGLSRSDSERAVALLAQHIVERARDQAKVDLEAEVKIVTKHFLAEKKARQPVTVGKK
jgi:1-acyl-sn-glycerol-3-phosphate acyltransferase